jgi:hypothetical protein
MQLRSGKALRRNHLSSSHLLAPRGAGGPPGCSSIDLQMMRRLRGGAPRRAHRVPSLALGYTREDGVRLAAQGFLLSNTPHEEDTGLARRTVPHDALRVAFHRAAPTRQGWQSGGSRIVPLFQADNNRQGVDPVVSFAWSELPKSMA